VVAGVGGAVAGVVVVVAAVVAAAAAATPRRHCLNSDLTSTVTSGWLTGKRWATPLSVA